MKVYLTYEQLKDVANHVVEQLRVKYAEQIKADRLFLFAIARGGLTFGQLVAYKMALPLGVVFPMASPHPMRVQHPTWDDLTNDDRAVFVYLEDVVAQGRTLTKVLTAHAAYYGSHVSAEFVPAVLDNNVDESIRSRVNIAGMTTSDWIVFPHEEIDHVVEGDRGLFRNQTSNNSKPI
jgi:hypoxanthine-guanine phosphoribosyltransferase